CGPPVGGGGGAAAARAAASAMADPSAIADPRIDEDVEDVHCQIDQHVRGGGDQDHALDDGVVAAEHRGDDQAPEPGNVEHDLGDEGAAAEDCHGDPDAR